MASFNDSVVKDLKSNVVLPKVTAEIHTDAVTTATENAEWAGRLYPPGNDGLTTGAEYVLEIPELVPCRIKPLGPPNSEDGTVDFQGLGPKPDGTSSAS